MIRTSGGGNRDISMLTVPLAMLIAFALLSGGGVEGSLRTIERTLRAALDWLGQFVS
jgi:hypothetical protein